MKSKCNNLNKWFKYGSYYLYSHFLFLLLIFTTCGGDKKTGVVEFYCVDQSGAPIEKVTVSFNGKNQKSDEFGRCQFKVNMTDSIARYGVKISHVDNHRFIGPDNVYLKKRNILKYALNFLTDKNASVTRDLTLAHKANLKFIYPEKEQIPVDLDTIKESDKPIEDKSKLLPMATYSLTIKPTLEESLITIYKYKTSKKKAKIDRQVVHQAYKISKQFTLKLEKGNYIINGKPFYFKYYKPIEKHVNLVANNQITLDHLVYPIDIEIINTPEGAEVFVNDKLISGKKIKLTEEGIYKIEIKKSGFQIKSQTIDFHPAINKGIIIGNKKEDIPYNKKIILDGTLYKL